MTPPKFRNPNRINSSFDYGIDPDFDTGVNPGSGIRPLRPDYPDEPTSLISGLSEPLETGGWLGRTTIPPEVGGIPQNVWTDGPTPDPMPRHPLGAPEPLRKIVSEPLGGFVQPPVGRIPSLPPIVREDIRPLVSPPPAQPTNPAGPLARQQTPEAAVAVAREQIAKLPKPDNLIKHENDRSLSIKRKFGLDQTHTRKVVDAVANKYGLRRDLALEYVENNKVFEKSFRQQLNSDTKNWGQALNNTLGTIEVLHANENWAGSEMAEMGTGELVGMVVGAVAGGAVGALTGPGTAAGLAVAGGETGRILGKGVDDVVVPYVKGKIQEWVDDRNGTVHVKLP